MELYERSARYYDLIYGPIVDYIRETDLLEAVFARYAARPVRTVLDLGCGTGNHSVGLAERGYDVLGLDRNEPFLELARGKAAKLDRPPRFVLGDMRELGEMGPFDALISMFGAFDHIPPAEAGETLAGFRERLEPGGVLAFEWWNESGARDGHQDWSEREGEGIRLIRMGEARVDKEAHTLHIRFNHLVLRGDHLAEEFTEQATMALYEASNVEALLHEAGLTPVATLDWTQKTLEPHRPEDFRALSVARKDG